MALTKRSAGIVSATSALRIAKVGWPHQSGDPAMMKTCTGRNASVNARDHHDARQRGVADPHRTEHVAMTQPIADDAEHRCDQRAEILQ